VTRKVVVLGATGSIGSQTIEVAASLGLEVVALAARSPSAKLAGARSQIIVPMLKDDALIGATSIGWTDHVGALRGLIQGRVRLGEWKARLLADPTQFMTAYLGAAQKAA